ncbi:MAG: TrmJ/YjtD family RNA methyltransferase [Candidatus Nanoarchaeia archaeon]|nr:TrmJ/YjtD family RNA methyltransferase [Candidatus Nanoarchaeia archaeon]
MISVAVVGAQTSGNLGAISRAMANFGIKDLYLVNSECEIITDESKARAMRSINILEKAKIIKDLSEIKADYLIATSAKLGSSSNIHRLYLTPKELAKNIDSNLNYCIVIGREDKGLLNEEIKQCSILVHIPTSKDYKALNISHALTIILYELSSKDDCLEKLANKRELKAVIMRLDELKKGIINFDNFKEVFVNVINRAFLRKKEARALAGLLKKIKENK